MSTPKLRSHNWFGKKDLDGFAHRSWIKAEGFSELMFEGCDFDFLRGNTPVRAEDTAGPSHS